MTVSASPAVSPQAPDLWPADCRLGRIFAIGLIRWDASTLSPKASLGISQPARCEASRFPSMPRFRMARCLIGRSVDRALPSIGAGPEPFTRSSGKRSRNPLWLISPDKMGCWKPRDESELPRHPAFCEVLEGRVYGLFCALVESAQTGCRCAGVVC